MQGRHGFDHNHTHEILNNAREFAEPHEFAMAGKHSLDRASKLVRARYLSSAREDCSANQFSCCDGAIDVLVYMSGLPTPSSLFPIPSTYFSLWHQQIPERKIPVHPPATVLTGAAGHAKESGSSVTRRALGVGGARSEE